MFARPLRVGERAAPWPTRGLGGPRGALVPAVVLALRVNALELPHDALLGDALELLLVAVLAPAVAHGISA
eukprot:13684525-Alexandrium_andersonii.AAC.1